MAKLPLSVLKISIIIFVPLVFGTGGKAIAQNYFGAIAYSAATGSHGYSFDYGSKEAAERAAVNACEQFAASGDCAPLVWFKNACGALAVANNGAAGSGWGSDRTLAERYALESCSDVGGGCRIVRWVCTTR